MLTISADLSSLSTDQREALSGFIINFPQSPNVLAADEPSPEKAFSPIQTDAPEAQNGPKLVASSQNESNLDKAGLPWDERIHSSSRALTVDGLWRKKRGVDDATVVTVESQLKQLMALPTPAASELPPPAAVAPVAAVPPPPPAPPAPPAPVAADGRQAFINLVGRVSETIPAGKLTLEEVQKACTDAGVPSLPLLANRVDLIPQVALTLEALIASRG